MINFTFHGSILRTFVNQAVERGLFTSIHGLSLALMLLLTPATVHAEPIDDLYTGLQIYEVAEGKAKAFFDVQVLGTAPFTMERAQPLFDSLVENAGEIIPFYTLEKPTSIRVEIIAITNIDEYNAGAGFVSVGEANLSQHVGVWKLDSLMLKTDEAKN